MSNHNDVDDIDDDDSLVDGLSSVSENNQDDTSSRGGDTTNEVSGDGHSCTTSEWAEKERKSVKRVKYLVVLLLMFAAIACGWFTYYIIKREEHQQFQKNFEDKAKMLTEISETRAKAIYSRIKNFAATITSYSRSQGATWPWVVVPNFEPRGLQTNAILQSPMVAVAPIVPHDKKSDWEDFTVQNQGWVREGVTYRQSVMTANNNNTSSDEQPTFGVLVSKIPTTVHQYHAAREDPALLQQQPVVVPFWQIAPAPKDPETVNLDLLSHPTLQPALMDMINFKEAILSAVVRSDYFYGQKDDDDDEEEEGNKLDNTTYHPPHSVLFQPIYESLEHDHHHHGHKERVVAALTAFLPWASYLENVLPNGIAPLLVVINNTCGDTFSFEVEGRTATSLGEGNHYHDPTYEDIAITYSFKPFLREGVEAELSCAYAMHIYPTRALEEQYQTATPVLYTTMVVFVFFCTTMVFFVYDFYVIKHQDQQAAIAVKGNAIISGMFPTKVRKRIMQDAQAQVDREMQGKRKSYTFLGTTSKIKNFIYEGSGAAETSNVPPIADNYNAATVLFGDIAGFTAWSSIRSPENVFILLETLYHAFDEIALRRRVYKVETIGDCYVAAAGVPEPRDDHAVVMARFAKDIQRRMNDLTERLEMELGPDTGDLSLRVGLHSGPLTAGVIRGDKARFQLFGATVDKAARMESTGARNKIQVSQETAELLIKGNKGNWLQKRQDGGSASGQDSDPTFWLEIKVQSSPSTGSVSTVHSSTSINEESTSFPVPPKLESLASEGMRNSEKHSKRVAHLDEKTKRMVNWISKTLEILLRKVAARRIAARKDGEPVVGELSSSYGDTSDGKTVIAEVQEIISLPQIRSRALFPEKSVGEIQLSKAVLDQLHDYICIIASMYKHNPFHNFDHASHVCMSMNKLLNRIVAPDDILDSRVRNEKEMMQKLHDHTHGITSDPLTQFAVVFGALIHDVDHDGVPNAQLIREETPTAKLYKIAVAEQNSIDLAFHLLKEDAFVDLRATIHATESEKKRFRQLVVNSVIATDIADKQLKELRNSRWAKAFKQGDAANHVDDNPRDEINRKATIVIEHLIQASDVAHTMQHWLMYRKWNERLYAEMMLAYLQGRSEVHPSQFWYKGELGFFDFYVIPLAKKLKECGVFGVSSDEYLNYAMQNRREWEARGEQAVAEMIAKYKTVEDIHASSATASG